MIRVLIVVFILLTAFIPVYTQSYKVKINGEHYNDNYFNATRILEVAKPQFGDYIEKVFYVKLRNYAGIQDIKKTLTLKLQSSGYTDIRISKIIKPFNKYFQSDLLSRSSRNLENVCLVEIENNFEIFEICDFLNKDKEYEYAVPVFNYKIFDYKPNDEKLPNQWYLDSIQITKSWDIAKGDSSILIGIVDSGTDYLHEDLKTQVWVNAKEIPNDGKDNDGNGFVDDVNGWDFVGNISLNDAVQGKFVEDSNPIPSVISNDHGTHVAGIAAANTNNGTGIASTGFDIRFIPVKIAIDDLSKSRMVYRPYDGLLYAASMGANIINCSWASSYHDPLAWDVVNQVLDMGIVVVSASGNENLWLDMLPYYPAAIPGVISVGAYDQLGNKSTFSNFGVRVQCFAPGNNIYSLLTDNRYGSKNGTSMASPIVAGFIASLKKIFPKFTSKQIAHQIRSSGDSFKNSNILSQSKLNCYNAVRYNNSDFPTFKSPGLEIERVLISDTNFISGYGTTKIKLVLKNYLSDAVNVKVNLSRQDDYFDLSQKSFAYPELKKGDSIIIDIDFSLFESCPWYEGESVILANFEANNYKNAQLFEIPIKIPSNNKYFLVHTFQENYLIDWYGSSSNGLFNFWSVGYDYYTKRGVLYNFGKINGLVSPTLDTLIGVSSLDDNNIYVAANGKDSKVTLMKSTNAGINFTNNNLSQFFDRLTGLQFLSTTDGYVIGINSQNKGDIVYTTNGSIFKNSTFDFVLSTDEYFLTKPVIRNKINYLATNLGKIVYSEDNGFNWKLYSKELNNFVMDISPINQDTLFAFVLNQNYEPSIRITRDGGKTFTDISPNNIDLKQILNIYVPPNSSIFYFVLNDGKIYSTPDIGKSWKPELNSQYKFDGLMQAFDFSINGKVRLWLAGLDISYLDYDMIPTDIIHDVRIAGRNNIKFDTLTINSSKEDIIFLENKGNYREEIESQTFTTGIAFGLSDNFKQSIASGELISATIKYNPQTTGLHFDTLNIKINSKDTLIKFYITGFAYDPANVNSQVSNNRIILYSDENNYYLKSTINLSGISNISVISSEGKLVCDYGKFTDIQSNVDIILKKQNLSSGLYYLVVKNEKTYKSIPMIVLN